MLSKAVENAQKKIEGNNYGIRKNLLEYDQVMNDQREIIYGERRRVLDGENMREVVLNMARETISNEVNSIIHDGSSPSDWDLNELKEVLVPIIPYEDFSVNPEDYSNYTKDTLIKELTDKAIGIYEDKEKQFPEIDHLRELERVVLLKVIDRKWMDHIDDMDQLRQGIGLQAYGQRDPLVEYKFAGYDMFDELTQGISLETVRALMHVRIEQKAEREEVAKVTGTNEDTSLSKAPVRRKEDKVYPNDPCPCGSGKKYKQCCGRK